MIELNIIDKLGNHTYYNLYYFSIFQHISFGKVFYDYSCSFMQLLDNLTQSNQKIIK